MCFFCYVVSFLVSVFLLYCFFFFNDTATTEIYTLSLHDALPIWPSRRRSTGRWTRTWPPPSLLDRKSTRLNSSHQLISYAVFCLKKKKNISTRKIAKKSNKIAQKISRKRKMQ